MMEINNNFLMKIRSKLNLHPCHQKVEYEIAVLYSIVSFFICLLYVADK